MSYAEIEKLKSVKDFDALVEYLRDVLYWPIEAEDAEDITFDYNPTELGIERKYAAKIKTIKQIRPLTDNQPWGLFYVEFAPKKLPVGVLRRILKALIHSRRQRDDRLPTWDFSDLIFISSLGELDERTISFAQFSTSEQGLPELRPFSWDASDTYFHYLQNTRDLEKLRWPKDENDAEAWREQWSSAFRLTHRYVIRTSRELAVKMAQLAAQIRDQVKSVYDYEVASGPLHKLFENFKKILIYDLEVDTFADMYAQTIAYGLFSAKATHEGEFAIEDISAMIPTTNPFLRNLFEECTRIGETQRDCLDLEELGVTELVKMLKEVNIEAILQDFGRQKKGEDPVIHFYEDFLREYDPKQKVKRGIFYTPDSVVSFIVRSVDYLLRTEFCCPDGLADTSTIPVTYKNTKINGEVIEEVKQVPKVQILDPATGTGTFLKYVIEEIKKTFDEKHKDLREEELRKEWNEYVNKNLLPRVFGFELLMAPYAIAHLKLGLKLMETGYEFSSHQRLGVALTNTLESGRESAEKLDAYLGWLAQESKYSNYVKISKNISVIIGNPPYSGHSMNKGKWITNLIEDYKKINSEKLKLGQAKWLQNDYVKFIRFCQWKLKGNMGIMALITDHSYVDSSTFVGMRASLTSFFNKIYILNLHGNAKRNKNIDDNDENVFDITQGVSIIIAVKNNDNRSKCFVYELRGDRNFKYSWLANNNLSTITWEEADISPPYYLFKSSKLSHVTEFSKGIYFPDIVQPYWGGEKAKRVGTGFVTTHDSFAISWDAPESILKVFKLLNTKTEEEARKIFRLCSQDQWNYFRAKKDLSKEETWKKQTVEVLYRPFDFRWTIWNSHVCVHRRLEANVHLLDGDNIALCIGQAGNVIGSDLWSLALITKYPVDFNLFYRGGCGVFPAYLIDRDKNSKSPNLSSDTIKVIENRLDLNVIEKRRGNLTNTIGIYDVFSYLYAILYSGDYRKRYSLLLDVDYPRIPFTSNKKLFSKLRPHRKITYQNQVPTCTPTSLGTME